MKNRTTMDAAGGIAIPKQVRDALTIGPGDLLELTAYGDDKIIRPVRSAASLVKEQGIWVYLSQTPSSNVDINKLIDQNRDEHIETLARH